MKKHYIITAGVLLSVLAIAGNERQAQAAKETAVKAELKKGTLTISGKGAMPAKLEIKNKNKVKKVVIKKGVSSISNNIFKNYKNLKTVVIPKTVTKIGWQSFSGTSIKKLSVPSGVKTIGQEAFSNISKLEKLTIPGKFSIKAMKGDDRSNMVCNKVDTVAFNTKLDIKRTSAFTSDNFIVSKSDTKYKSIDGVIYSKDGKSIVRVPFMRKELVIDGSCEHFALQSVLAVNVDNEGDPVGGCQVKKIVIPPSVKKVESAQYSGICRDESFFSGERNEGIELEIQSKQLDGASLNELIVWLGVKPQEIMRQCPERIRVVNNMYISSDGILLKYTGTEKEITIPSEVKKIGNHAFENNRIKSLVLPNTVTSYGEYAFVNNPITDVALPETMKTVPAGMFSGCGLKRIVIPDSVLTIGERAFYGVNFSSLTLPATISHVGSGAFANDGEDAPETRNITISGSSKGVENFAFKTPEDTLAYKKSNREMRTFFDSSYGNLKKLTAQIAFKWNKVKGADGYQAVFSADKEFKKNKKTIMLRKNRKKADVSVKVKKSQIKRGENVKTVVVYGKIRPYKVINGKKVYGRWTVNKFQCDEY